MMFHQPRGPQVVFKSVQAVENQISEGFLIQFVPQVMDVIDFWRMSPRLQTHFFLAKILV
jgi:hypothetical protein